MNRKCNKCKNLVSDINLRTGRLYTVCKLCRELDKVYALKRRKTHKSQISKSRKLNRVNLKNKFLEMYGKVCSHCGDTRKRMLTVDHINNDGKAHRVSCHESVYKDVIREYRPDMYRTLCIACNWHRGMYKELPELEFCYQDIREG